MRPRSRFLTHRYPMWQGCSLQELSLLIAGIIAIFVLASFLLSIFVGYFSLFVLISTLFLYPAARFSVTLFARYKKGKPQNFVMQDIARRFGIGKKHRLSRIGVWQTRRILKNNSKEDRC